MRFWNIKTASLVDLKPVIVTLVILTVAAISFLTNCQFAEAAMQNYSPPSADFTVTAPAPLTPSVKDSQDIYMLSDTNGIFVVVRVKPESGVEKLFVSKIEEKGCKMLAEHPAHGLGWSGTYFRFLRSDGVPYFALYAHATEADIAYCVANVCSDPNASKSAFIDSFSVDNAKASVLSRNEPGKIDWQELVRRSASLIMTAYITMRVRKEFPNGLKRFKAASKSEK